MYNCWRSIINFCYRPDPSGATKVEENKSPKIEEPKRYKKDNIFVFHIFESKIVEAQLALNARNWTVHRQLFKINEHARWRVIPPAGTDDDTVNNDIDEFKKTWLATVYLDGIAKCAKY